MDWLQFQLCLVGPDFSGSVDRRPISHFPEFVAGEEWYRAVLQGATSGGSGEGAGDREVGCADDVDDVIEFG